ncbi:MAG: orotidine-5'-phosphate decarboxylase [Mycoplasmataceae bacterium]|jgi:orotidine-5'-phosphate decarboxylase|nr:orotidine-5'-phosphate decarboxylase [Mycoplasmataceae bacterium]
MERDVIIACDFDGELQLRNFLKYFKSEKPFLKIGYQLFYATGKDLISKLIQEGYRIFLDLKLHDIPTTVAKGIKQLASLGVSFITVHASGGMEMMQAAVQAVQNTPTKILAVTQLTSIDQQKLEVEILIDRKLKDVVNHYTVNALEAGVHGVICSAVEAGYIKTKISPNILCITPGIRINDQQDDHARATTPKFAHNNHVDYIVVGRPITTASNPLQVYLLYKQEFLGE